MIKNQFEEKIYTKKILKMGHLKTWLLFNEDVGDKSFRIVFDGNPWEKPTPEDIKNVIQTVTTGTVDVFTDVESDSEYKAYFKAIVKGDSGLREQTVREALWGGIQGKTTVALLLPTAP